MAAAILLALLAQVADGPVAPATPQVALSRMVACGVKPDDATIRVDDTLQEAVVAVRPGTSLTDMQLGCLARASVATIWFVTFDAATDARYEPLYSHASAVAYAAKARAWAAADARKSRVPLFDPAHDDRAVAVARIEKLCGARPGSFPNYDTPEQQASAPPLASLPGETLACFLDLAAAGGVEMRFIGNEAEAPAPPR